MSNAAPVGSPPVGLTAGPGCRSVDAGRVACEGSPTNVYYDAGDGVNLFSLGTVGSSKMLGTIELYGGAERDFFSVLPVSGDVYAELGGGPDAFGVSQAHLPAVEVYGEAGDDGLNGSASGSDILDGGTGNDRLEGGGGADLLDLGPGNDVGEGDGGDDLIRGGPGNDKLAGGADHDDLYGDEGEDEFGADHNYVTGFTLIPISGPTAQTQGDDELFLRELHPERDTVFFETFDPPVRGGCAGGDDYVEADSIDVVPLNVGCETIDRPGTPAALSISPAAQEFGLIQVGFNSMVRAITLTNSGDLASAALQTALGGGDAGEFAITASDCPQGQPLLGHTSCTVGVRFSPTSAGPKSATLAVGGLSVELSGTGHQPAPTQPPAPVPQPVPPPEPPAPGPAPQPQPDRIAPPIADITRALQQLAAALRGQFTATISTNEAGTWSVQVFGQARLAAGPRTVSSRAARQVLLASRTATVAGAGSWQVKLPFKAATKKRLQRLRVVRLVVRSTFTDASGNRSKATRNVTLRK